MIFKEDKFPCDVQENTNRRRLNEIPKTAEDWRAGFNKKLHIMKRIQA